MLTREDGNHVFFSCTYIERRLSTPTYIATQSLHTFSYRHPPSPHCSTLLPTLLLPALRSVWYTPRVVRTYQRSRFHPHLGPVLQYCVYLTNYLGHPYTRPVPPGLGEKLAALFPTTTRIVTLALPLTRLCRWSPPTRYLLFLKLRRATFMVTGPPPTH